MDRPDDRAKAQPHKLVIYVSQDQRNGGAQGVGDGAQAAAKAIGWDFRIIDGQGSVAQHTSALNEAIALKPDGIILGTIDAKEQSPVVEHAVKLGIKVVGWHSAGEPGPVKDPPVITNITTDPTEVGKLAALYAVVDFERHRRRGGDRRQPLRDQHRQDRCRDRRDQGMQGLHGAGVRGHADRRRREPDAAARDHAAGEVWQEMDLHDRGERSLVRLHGPVAAGRRRRSRGRLSAADFRGRRLGAGFQRIRRKHYQIGTVAEPLHLHGWMCIDELNRAFAGDKPSGFVPPPHLFIAANINRDGGANNIYDPENGYKDIYKKIWGK